MKSRILTTIIEFIGVLVLVLFFAYIDEDTVESYSIDGIPDYNGEGYVIINNNEPDFDDLSHTKETFEVYGELDSLGRCTSAYANLGIDLMPTEKREDIYYIKPTGWSGVKYDFIEGGNLYNRCHLIAFSLAGENANQNNLITCTRYMNATTMLEFENKVGNYIRKTKNHVLYRVTPMFSGDNLLATGAQMEALSIEDNGKGIKFNVFVYNVQPGVDINYKNGENNLTAK